MAVTTTRPSPEAPMATEPIPVPVLGHALRPGIVLLDAPGGGGAGEPRADDRALALLGCRDGAELAARWPAIRQRLAAGGLRLEDPAGTAEVELPPDLTGGHRVRVSPVFIARAATAATAAASATSAAAGAAGHRPTSATAAATAGHRATAATAVTAATAAAAATGGDGPPEAPAALLLQDAELATALESDLRAAAQMRSLAQIAPAVAHDLRAPINAMVLNLEVLKETLAPPPGSAPGNPAHPAAGLAHPASSPYGPHAGPAQRPGSASRDPRDRQQRYLAVLREELARLHQLLELFLAHVSPRGERQETLDWREPAQDLAALLRPPAHKQQAQIELLLPDTAVPIVAHRYLLRQALLHLGLAILERVPRDGTLEIRLDRLPARARLRIAASAQPGKAAAPRTITAPAVAPATAAPAASSAAAAPSTSAPPAAAAAPSTAAAPATTAPPTAAPAPAAPAPLTAAAPSTTTPPTAAPAPAAPAAAAPSTAAAPATTTPPTDAREQVAHAIVAAFGGTSWPAHPDGDLAFEIEFPLAESN